MRSGKLLLVSHKYDIKNLTICQIYFLLISQFLFLNKYIQLCKLELIIAAQSYQNEKLTIKLADTMLFLAHLKPRMVNVYNG